MATVRAYVPIDMQSLGVSYGEVESYTLSRIVISDGARETVYGGDFSYSYDGDVFGTLRTIENKLGGRLLWEASSINRDAHHFTDLLLQDDGDSAAEYVLSGRDTFFGSGGRDVISGYAEHDILNGRAGNDDLRGDTGNDLLSGGAGNDALDGSQGNDRLTGEGGNDVLQGGWGSDDLSGGWGRDVLMGGVHADRLTGGGAADTFRFNNASEAGLGASVDRILDFAHGDKIDLRGIDADEAAPGDQAFHYIWSARFSGAGAELRYDNGLLSGDIDGDRAADLAIKVFGEDALFKLDLLL